ncbi:MAG: YIP1 family protein [Haloarculaceae archaeon]
MPRTPLVAPTSYFRQADRPSLARAAGIVLLEGVATGVALWFFMQRVLSRVDVSAAARAEVQSTVTGALAGVVVVLFVGWALLAAFLHVFVWFSGDNRGFGTTLAVVGEAELAGVVTLPLTTVALLALAGQTPSDPQAAAAFFRRATSFSSPLLLLVSFLTTCWKAAIQGFGLAESHGIDPGKALALTVVVGLLGFLVNLV